MPLLSAIEKETWDFVSRNPLSLAVIVQGGCRTADIVMFSSVNWNKRCKVNKKTTDNLGIGTTSPSSTLHVIGEINVSGVSGSGKVVCVKADGAFGVCSDQPGGSGTCTCG